MTKPMVSSGVSEFMAGRLEPDITPIDAGAFYASLAISAKRAADAAEQQAAVITEYIVYLRLRDAQNDLTMERG